MGAATSAPVGAYVISFNVIAERFNVSRHRPAYVDCRSQACQNATVSSCIRHASATGMRRTGPAGPVRRTRPRICPAVSVNSACTSPCSSTRGVASRSSSGSPIRLTVSAVVDPWKTAPSSVSRVSDVSRA